MIERRQVWYRGRVQGVGFRATVRSIAEDYSVTGYVQNLADGRVSTVAEGAPDELDAFFHDIQRRLGRYIRDTQSVVEPGGGEFPGFQIRY